MARAYGCDGRIWRLASSILAIRSYDRRRYGLVRAEISRLVWLLRKILGGISASLRSSQWRVGAFPVPQPAAAVPGVPDALYISANRHFNRPNQRVRRKATRVLFRFL